MPNLLYLPVLYWVYLGVYILRASHGRYLLPLAPVVILFFILYIRDGYKDICFSRWIIAGTAFFVLAGMTFETSYIGVKAALNVVLLTLLISLVYLYKKYRQESPLIKVAQVALVVVLGLGMAASALAFSYTKGQIRNFLNWGREWQVREIISHVDDAEHIWITPLLKWGQLPEFYRSDTHMEQFYAHKWVLRGWIPKETAFLRNAPTTYSFYWNDIEEFRSDVTSYGIEYILLIQSRYPGVKFPMEDNFVLLDDHTYLYSDAFVTLRSKLPQGDNFVLLEDQKWIDLIDIVELKNKRLYLLSVSGKDR